jgi:hypothetical protein
VPNVTEKKKSWDICCFLSTESEKKAAFRTNGPDTGMDWKPSEIVMECILPDRSTCNCFTFVEYLNWEMLPSIERRTSAITRNQNYLHENTMGEEIVQLLR